jgi:hypothetical protein
MALPTGSDAREVLKYPISRLDPVLGCPHLPAFGERLVGPLTRRWHHPTPG